MVRLYRFRGALSGAIVGRPEAARRARPVDGVRPAILLFDEPLSALDLSLRLQLRAEIKRLHDELGFSAIYVTHDQGEAMAMSSRVAVMNKGHIVQIDTPTRIFHAPASEFVFTFIGESCCLPVTADGERARGQERQSGRSDARCPAGGWRVAALRAPVARS